MIAVEIITTENAFSQVLVFLAYNLVVIWLAADSLPQDIGRMDFEDGLTIEVKNDLQNVCTYPEVNMEGPIWAVLDTALHGRGEIRTWILPEMMTKSYLGLHRIQMVKPVLGREAKSKAPTQTNK